jgi:D-arabinitol dehydrogenase (NADP+)
VSASGRGGRGRERGHKLTSSIIGSFSQTHCFPRAVALLDSKKIRTDGMVTDVLPLKDYQKALDLMASRKALKIAIRP